MTRASDAAYAVLALLSLALGTVLSGRPMTLCAVAWWLRCRPWVVVLDAALWRWRGERGHCQRQAEWWL